MRYLIPGTLKLLISILHRYPNFFVPYREHLFGLFGKVLTDLRLEEDAMGLLAAIVQVTPIEDISTELIASVEKFLKRMMLYKNNSKSNKIPDGFLKSVFVFIGRYVLSNGVESLFQLFNAVKDGILENFFEKEGFFIGRIDKNEFYRKHVIAGFAKIVTEATHLNGTPAMVILCQGLIQAITPFGKLRLGRDDADEGAAADYQEDLKSFERTSYQPLFSLFNLDQNSLTILPEELSNPTLYVMQCIQAVTPNQNQDFLDSVGKALPKATKDHFAAKLEEYNISLN